MAMLRLADPEALLWYEDLAGSGPPAVYLHGLTGSSAGLLGLARHPLLAHRHAILLDLVGHGCSEPVAGFACGPEDHARVVAALLDHVGAAGAAVVAHSAGGPVAICLASARPDLVSRLILAEGNVDPALAGVSRVIAAMPEDEYATDGHAAMVAQAREVALAGDAVMAAAYGSARFADPRMVHRTAARMLADARPTLWERFAGLAIPRAYIYGERNIQQPQHARFAERLRDVGIAVLAVPDAGHGMMVDNLDGTAEAIAAALVGT